MIDDSAEEIPEVASAQTPSSKQQLFLRYFTAILIDLTVLNLFDEYWDWVTVDSFTISVLVAILLQILLNLTLALEHRVAAHFQARPGTSAKIMRALSAWLILFGSKFVILFAIDIIFGSRILFGGPYHGVVTFIVLVITMLIAEELILRFYRRLS